MRFRLRTLLIVVTAFGALCGVACWWTTPPVWHRELIKGKLTEDMFFRYDFPKGFVATGLVQYYSNGKKAKEIRYGKGSGLNSFPHLDGYPRYWLDDGTEVSREEFDRRIQALIQENR